jgi:hypothetical protein
MPLDLLLRWLHRTLDDAGRAWLDAKRALLNDTLNDRDLYIAVGLAPRKLGKAPLALSAQDLIEAEAARPGWNPTGLRVDEAARLALLLTAAQHGEPFYTALEQLWRTADVNEQISFYKGLPLYPDAAQVHWRATNGCRTSIDDVFEAIAHRNPYPAEHFDEVAWNQMCLKALFVGAPLHPVVGLDTRHNRSLARMMADYAFERWAAARVVPYELWRCVGTDPDPRSVSALKRAITEGDELTRRAATLAASTSQVPDAAKLIAEASDLEAEIQAGTLTWATLADRTKGEAS